MISHGRRLCLLLLILAAYGWRTHGLTTQSLWRDEVDAVYFALRDLPETLSMFVAMAQNGPLYFPHCASGLSLPVPVSLRCATSPLSPARLPFH
ncbi:MAG: hypothetical protein R2867_01840 [Caldilineaceae bacterium]